MQSRLQILLFFAILWLPLPAYSVDETGLRAERFIDILSSEALKLATNTALSSGDRRQEIAKILNQGFDMPWIARFVLGRNWRLANPQQRKEYLNLFQAIVEHTYSRQGSPEFRIKTPPSNKNPPHLILRFLPRTFRKSVRRAQQLSSIKKPPLSF